MCIQCQQRPELLQLELQKIISHNVAAGNKIVFSERTGNVLNTKPLISLGRTMFKNKHKQKTKIKTKQRMHVCLYVSMTHGCTSPSRPEESIRMAGMRGSNKPSDVSAGNVQEKQESLTHVASLQPIFLS